MEYNNNNNSRSADNPNESGNGEPALTSTTQNPERGGSADSTDPSQSVPPVSTTTTPPGQSDGIIALKVTPFSIKAFIKYFANDIIGVYYEIPKDCMEANLALTEALFFR